MGYGHEIIRFYLNMIDLLADEKITVSQFIQNLGYFLLMLPENKSYSRPFPIVCKR